ncbi:hypothetical protein [Burkholderia sp. BCC1644]|uniref:hypothetical protein n=2 Tax=Burkholderia TaxID=32008 RepID=UPI001FC7D4E1|nr:hypothetical protein [Burkholderia sp. BCC1644]
MTCLPRQRERAQRDAARNFRCSVLLLNSLNDRQPVGNLPYHPAVILADAEHGRPAAGNGRGFFYRQLESGADFIRTPGPIMFQSPGDSFVSGSLLGLCVEVPLAALVSLAMHGVDWNGQRIAMLVATPVLIACIALLTRPVAFSTIWKHKRSPFVLDDNVRASIYGRLSGIALGLVFGIMVATTFS